MKLREAIALAVLVVVTAVPFLNKAYHVDDPLMLRVAEEVLVSPLEPFMGEFDCAGRVMPLWKLATNPPLISYWVAPIARRANFSEVAIHVGMLPFLLLLAWGVFSLARRFCGERWWPVLFAMTSAGVVVSGNVMQDVPATGLVTAGVAAFVTGSDRNDRRHLLAGSLLGGLAILMKYSAVVVVPLLLLYPLLKGRSRVLPWALVSLIPFALWCLHNLQLHGELHVLEVSGRSSGPGVAWRRNLVGLFAVLGSLLYLTPVLLARAIADRDRVALAAAAATAVGVGVAVRAFLGRSDFQHLFWTLLGTLLVGVCASDGIRRMLRRPWSAGGPDAPDSAFLVAWLAAPIVFSIAFPPFQAVRHLIPALPPLVLLGFRYLRSPAPARPRWLRFGLGAALAVQAALAFVVARADADQADVYRDFAAKLSETASRRSGDTWFVGHWGWQYYAVRAGLRQLHGLGGPRPREGDFVIWPEQVLRGPFHRKPDDLGLRLRELDRVVYPPSLPVRTLGIPQGAGFYALAARPPNVPYRFFEGAPLESFRVFEVLGDRRAR